MSDEVTLQIPTARIFEPLLTHARYKGAYGGRGAGKSHFFAGLCIEEALNIPGYRMLCVREVQKSLKDSVKRLLEDIIHKNNLETYFDSQTGETKIKGGGVISYVGMQDHTADTIKSFEGYDRAWIEEAHTLSERSLELLRPTIRKPGSEIWASWNPRNANDPIDYLLRGNHVPEEAVVIRALYKDNPWFPRELEAERQHDKDNNRDRYAHIWEGAYEPQAIGAIWSRDILHQTRVTDAPELKRIVVAVDPAISSDKGADEHGIIAIGLGVDGEAYVLEDGSTRGSPRQWARRAIALFDLHEADCIVIETNQGGEMCKATLQAERPSVPVIDVWAARGKHVRAEPISALYELKRVHHVGTFNELEDQMCLMTADGYQGSGSPDRVDALVWGLTELFKELVTPSKPKTKREYVAPHTHSGGGWML